MLPRENRTAPAITKYQDWGKVVAYLKLGILLLLTLATGACVRGDDEFVVPLGHPAEPGARGGAVLVGSNALDPELQTVKPQLGGAAATKSAPPAGGHQH